MLVVTSVDKCDGLRIASDSTLHRGFGTVTFGATGMDRQPEAAGCHVLAACWDCGSSCPY